MQNLQNELVEHLLIYTLDVPVEHPSFDWFLLGQVLVDDSLHFGGKRGVKSAGVAADQCEVHFCLIVFLEPEVVVIHDLGLSVQLQLLALQTNNVVGLQTLFFVAFSLLDWLKLSDRLDKSTISHFLAILVSYQSSSQLIAFEIFRWLSQIFPIQIKTVGPGFICFSNVRKRQNVVERGKPVRQR